jgi:hypothetical protein
MKTLLIAIAGLVVSACSSSTMAMMTGNFDTALELERGTGGIRTLPDGRQAFTYGIYKDAMAGAYKTQGELEHARRYNIGTWMAETKNCPKGYTVTKRREEASGPNTLIVYEGVCK